MARNKLKAVEVKNGSGKLFDGAGLYLLKREADKGRWIYRYKHQGRSREMGLGPYPAVSLAEARKSRDAWEVILRSGEDPIAARDRQRADQRAEASRSDPTFAEAAETTFEAKKAGLRRDGASGRWLSPIRLYMLPAVGGMRMSQIHQTDIHRALAPIWRKKHPTAEKAIQRTKIIFEHMRFSGVECDPFMVDMAKHMLGEVRHQIKKTPASAWQDIPRIYAALNRDDASHLCLRFKILTLVRSAGVRDARFAEIDGDVWTVPEDRMKGSEGKVSDFRVPLSSAALEVVARAEKWKRSAYMFPGGRSGGISDVAIGKVFRKIDPTGTPHGLRTSFRTWVQDTDAAHYDVAETALAHIIGGKVERAYARSDMLERRRSLMEAWAQFVTGAKENVVPIRGRAG
ncbi:integrase arm-type DNA-binding domain-containing protein [Phaeobacter sp. JH20_41]|uniref:tyrosine-type recombinase/integrase n=1 Tax=Phaeobacter sp. JH20_41 TaxID=3112498 RepID=UPI003A8756C0